ncbi:mitochondrial carrier protein, putative [Plasmodium ovale wallikeri]|uniref:Mitochondrial carrier protein, putative n=2 Tax=Plasmodium ovale TaxID=36330 RepID=A0A1A8YPU8_PLAOA|nr:mitochondrial carrier protein, putative [Plasmodium ovale wallikeri]SBT33644.1 mitochondrial carrier protein, putative [Plasmodium ovale wallikeri]
MNDKEQKKGKKKKKKKIELKDRNQKKKGAFLRIYGMPIFVACPRYITKFSCKSNAKMNELSVNDGFDDIEVESFDFIWEEWEEYKGDVPLWQHIFCGSIAGLMEHVFMYPLDTLKTYIQTDGRLKSNKHTFERCKVYNCSGSNNHFKELNVHNSMHMDKKNFCTSTKGCDNCIYSKMCNYNNICNVKIDEHVNRRNFGGVNMLDGPMPKMLKKKLNIFPYSSLNTWERSMTSYVINKRLKHNNFCNKRTGKNRSRNYNYTGANSRYTHIHNWGSERRRNLFCNSSQICDDIRVLRNCKNERVSLLMRRNAGKIDRIHFYGGQGEISEKVENKYRHTGRKHSIKESSTSVSKCGRFICGDNYKKKKLSHFLVNNKGSNFFCSRKVVSKIIFKKDNDVKFPRRMDYYASSIQNESVNNCKYDPKCSNKLKLLLDKVDANHVKEENFSLGKRKNGIIFRSSILRNEVRLNEKSSTQSSHIKTGNSTSIVKDLKDILIRIKNRCHLDGGVNRIVEKNNIPFNPFIQKLSNTCYLEKEKATLAHHAYRGYRDCRGYCGNRGNVTKRATLYKGESGRGHAGRRSRFVQYDINNTFKGRSPLQSYHLNMHKNEKGEQNIITCLLRNVKNFFVSNCRFAKNKPLVVGKEFWMENCPIGGFSLLRSNNNIFLNNMLYVTKNNNCRSLFDRNIHSSRCSLYKNSNNSVIPPNMGFNRNLKSFNFFKTILHSMSNNSVNMRVRHNCSLIRNNVANLYKGVNVVVLGCIPAHAMYFSTFEYSKKYFSSMSSNNSPIKILNNNKIDGINHKLNDLNYFSIAVCGFLATIAHDLIITPIDTLKQRIQLGINKNSFDSIKILRENGLRSLYLSLPITLVMNIPYQIIMICTNEKMKKLYFEYVSGLNNIGKNNFDGKYSNNKNGHVVNNETTDMRSNTVTYNTHSNNLANAHVNGKNGENNSSNNLKNCFTDVRGRTNDLIKMNIERDIYSMNNYNKSREEKLVQDGVKNGDGYNKTDLSEEKRNTDILFKKIISKLEKKSNNDYTQNYEGKMNNSLHFPKEKYNNMELRNTWSDGFNKNEFFNKPFNHITSYFVCAGIGGGIAAVVTNPLDVIKTRIQTECFNTKGFNFFRVVSNLYYKEGVRSFFKGSLARMALCIPASAISWGTYETMKRFLKINFNSV